MRVRVPLAIALLGSVLLGAPLTDTSRGLAVSADAQYLPDGLASTFVVAADALQCSLLDTATQNNAGVRGQDGGYSFAQGGTVYWDWSDTFISATPGYIPNSVATAPLQPPRMPQAGESPLDTPCFPMQYRTGGGGAAAEMLTAPAPGCADWPTQLVSPDDSSTTLYFIYVRHAAETCSLTAGAGIGAFDTVSMTATRLDNGPVWLDTPGQPVQVTGGTPLRADGGEGEYIYMFLVAGGDPDALGSTTAVALARVAPTDFAVPSLYRYWTSSGWVPWDTFKALSPEDNGHFLWRQPDFGIQAGMKVSYVARLRKWVAVYATRLAGEVRIRTADRLTGPWSNESRIIDCRAQLASLPPHEGGAATPDWPCYTAMVHDELTSPDGLTLYISFARNNWEGGGDYRVYLRRFNLASPIYEWVAPDGARSLLPRSVAGDGARQGLAFFASEAPLSGYLPVYVFDARAPLPPDRVYSLSPLAPSGYTGGNIAFYAPRSTTPVNAAVRVVPVRAVLLNTGQHLYTIGPVPAGATDLGLAFSALQPVVDADADGVPDTGDNCVYAANPDQTDTDQDGAGDTCDMDDDNDNVPDSQLAGGLFPFAPRDNCRTIPNGDQLDMDGDGLGDACETVLFGTDPKVADTDGDGCRDGSEVAAGFDPRNPYDVFTVPVPALIIARDPTSSSKDGIVSASDVQAIATYFRIGAKAGTPSYDDDLNQNGVKDGLEYDRSVLGPAKSGPPDGVIGARDAMLAYAQFRRAYRC